MRAAAMGFRGAVQGGGLKETKKRERSEYNT